MHMGIMKRVLIAAVVAGAVVHADVYLHGMLRGSNDRNCRNDNNDERRNANRLFDSQNNADGGYSCPRSYPFPPEENNAQGEVDEYGRLKGANTIDTSPYYVYAGSEVQLEWTNQHGAGGNPNMHSDIIWQYMTDEEYELDNVFDEEWMGNRRLRDGTPINNNDGDNTNDEATTRIGGDGNGNNAYANLDKGDVSDGRYGYQESIANYKLCAYTSRNKGLFTADQEMRGNRQNARYTRQDNNGQRYGFECPEERDYYPYWRPSPWHDIAIISSDVERCENKQAPMSQNVEGKCNCVESKDKSFSENDPAPITEDECNNAQGKWACVEPWNSIKMCGWGGATWACDKKPDCLLAAYSRDNHLGNQMESPVPEGKPTDKTTQAATFTWKVPEFLKETKVVLRIRYNASTTGDFDMDTTDWRHSCEDPNDQTCLKSPIVDRDNREEMSYYDLGLAPEGSVNPEYYKLSIAVNSDQHARTFQDRTYVFVVKPLPTVNTNCRNKIKNLGMRGKRGNIVQTYPSVEYDFSPQEVEMTEDECLHIHWIGSDYNPNRNPNNGEGGPYNPNNANEAKADRTNMVQMGDDGANIPLTMAQIEEQGKCFWRTASGECDWATYRRYALLDQDFSKCMSVEELKAAGVNNRQQRERDPRNCGKLNGGTHKRSTPHFDGGIHKFSAGDYKFVSTRNNNFSNRSQKLRVKVRPADSSALSSAEIAGVTVGALLAFGLAGMLGMTFMRRRREKQQNRPATGQQMAKSAKGTAARPLV